MSDEKSQYESDVGSVTELERHHHHPYIRIIRLFAVVLFMSGLCGAFYYAIKVGEVGVAVPVHESGPWNVTSNYSAEMNQFSEFGFYTVTHQRPNSRVRNSSTVWSYWYQDDVNQRIVHGIDNVTVAHVLSNMTFWITVNSTGRPTDCVVDHKTGYLEYIKSLGLYNMNDKHSEVRRERDEKEVYLYEALPSATTEYNNRLHNTPLLVQAYVDNTYGFLLGWETHFAPTNVSDLVRTEYWYGDMLDATPPANVFKNLPTICQPNVNSLNS
jgi:hypothetical protein